MLNPNHSPNPIDKRATQVAHARVGTWLTPRERGGVDVAAGSQLTFTHRDTLQALRHDLITARIDTALVSAALVRRSDVPALSALIQDFPGTPTVGLVSEIEEARALAGALAFGQAGIRRLVDVRNVAGWSALRSAFDPERLRDPFFRKALRELTGKQNETDRPGCCTSGWDLTLGQSTPIDRSRTDCNHAGDSKLIRCPSSRGLLCCDRCGCGRRNSHPQPSLR